MIMMSMTALARDPRSKAFGQRLATLGRDHHKMEKGQLCRRVSTSPHVVEVALMGWNVECLRPSAYTRLPWAARPKFIHNVERWRHSRPFQSCPGPELCVRLTQTHKHAGHSPFRCWKQVADVVPSLSHKVPGAWC